jgi:hypothetical protein
MVSDHIFAGWVKCTVVVIPHMRMSSVHEDLPSSYLPQPIHDEKYRVCPIRRPPARSHLPPAALFLLILPVTQDFKQNARVYLSRSIYQPGSLPVLRYPREIEE